MFLANALVCCCLLDYLIVVLARCYAHPRNLCSFVCGLLLEFLKSWSKVNALKFVVFILAQKCQNNRKLILMRPYNKQRSSFRSLLVVQNGFRFWEQSMFPHFLWQGTCPQMLNLKILHRHWNDTAAEEQQPKAQFSFLRICRWALCFQTWSSSCSWGCSSSRARVPLTCFTAPLTASVGVEAFRGTGWRQWRFALKIAILYLIKFQK